MCVYYVTDCAVSAVDELSLYSVHHVIFVMIELVAMCDNRKILLQIRL